jgi:methionyl aminopeptidase
MKLGLNECIKNELLHGYPVLTEKKGEIVAQFTYTIAVRNEGPIIISGLPLDVSKFESDKKITDKNIEELLSSDLDNYLPNYKRTKKQEKKKKDNKAKRAAKKAAKQKRKEEALKKKEEEQ